LLEFGVATAGEAEERPTRSYRYYLQAGMVNLSIGIGLMGMFVAMRPNGWLWAIGLIPACLGVGFLLLYRLTRQDGE
jgi:Domain of unknown function (DUF6249)